jgi:hypothetical protein
MLGSWLDASSARSGARSRVGMLVVASAIAGLVVIQPGEVSAHTIDCRNKISVAPPEATTFGGSVSAIKSHGEITCTPWADAPNTAPFDLKIEVCVRTRSGERVTYDLACTNGDNTLSDSEYHAEADAYAGCEPGQRMGVQTWARAKGTHGNTGYSKKKTSEWVGITCPEPDAEVPQWRGILDMLFTFFSLPDVEAPDVDGTLDSACPTVSAATSEVGSQLGHVALWC